MWRWSLRACATSGTELLQQNVDESDLAEAKEGKGDPGQNFTPGLAALSSRRKAKPHAGATKADHVTTFKSGCLHRVTVDCGQRAFVDAEHD